VIYNGISYNGGGLGASSDDQPLREKFIISQPASYIEYKGHLGIYIT